MILAVLLSSCASLRPDFETPTVSLQSFAVAPGTTLAPRFEIGLRVVNPNDFALKLKGASYSVSLEGFEILTGVANDLPVIAAYGEGDFVIDAEADLLDSIRLFNSIATDPRDALDYELNAKLDIANFIVPIKINETGSISLVGNSTR